MLTITDSFLETWQQHQQLAFSPTCHELVDDSSFFSVDQLGRGGKKLMIPTDSQTDATLMSFEP